MAIVKKGDKAPHFELRNQYGDKINSKDIEGKILLEFHPLAFTGVCTDQMRDLEANYERIKEFGVTPFGVSVDAHPAKFVWGASLGLKKLDLLSDFNPQGELAEKLGIFVNKAGISGRAAILMDQEKIIWAKEYEKSERPDIEEIISHLGD